MQTFQTTGFHGHSVEFSPFHPNRLACAASQYYGIVGNGRQYILDITPTGIISILQFDTLNVLFDCAWSEQNENHIVSATGDGTIKLWDTSQPNNPLLASFEEHTEEVSSVNWNYTNKDFFISASWDKSIKIWDITKGVSISTYQNCHFDSIYNAVFAPSDPNIFCSVSGDHTLKIWSGNSPQPALSIPVSNFEVLSCDWNKYNEYEIVTGSVDQLLRTWDIRYPQTEVGCLAGHTYPIRRLKCSPFSQHIIGSVSYDMSSIIWNLQLEHPLAKRYENHKEFCVGLDFSMFDENLMATCGWDELIYLLPVL